MEIPGVVGGLGLILQDGILRVKGGVVSAGLCLAVEVVGAGLGEDLNAAVAEAVVLGRKRILVDANFADGRFRRQLAAGESVDVDFTTIGSRGWTGEGLQLIL